MWKGNLESAVRGEKVSMKTDIRGSRLVCTF